MKKYLIVPGYVTSRSDRQEHFIGARQLMRLYGVNPAECVVADDTRPGMNGQGLWPLRPRFDGNYRLPSSDEVEAYARRAGEGQPDNMR